MSKTIPDDDPKKQSRNVRVGRAEARSETMASAGAQIEDQNRVAAGAAAPWWWVRRSPG